MHEHLIFASLGYLNHLAINLSLSIIKVTMKLRD